MAARDVLTQVLAAADAAPFVPLTDEERSLLAEVEGKPVEWISHEGFIAAYRTRSDFF